MSSTCMTRHLAWDAIPSEHLAEGIERRMIYGDRLMICRLTFDPFVVTPVHQHPHEQMTLVERGRVRFFIEDAERIAVAGDVLHFAVEHQARRHDDGRGSRLD